MAEYRKTTVVCPSCRVAFSIDACVYIDAQQDSDLLRPLRYARLFRHCCPACRTETRYNYPFVYRDAALRFIGFCDARDPNARVPDREKAAALARCGYRLRIAHTAEEIVEKSDVLLAGFDDRVMELFKMVNLPAIREQNPDAKITSLRFFQCAQPRAMHLIARFSPRGGAMLRMAYDDCLMLHHAAQAHLPPEPQDGTFTRVDRSWFSRPEAQQMILGISHTLDEWNEAEDRYTPLLPEYAAAPEDICPHCTRQIPHGSRFCCYCGAALTPWITKD